MDQTLHSWMISPVALPTAANENLLVLRSDESPADGLAEARDAKRRLLRQLRANPTRLFDGSWRRDWDDVRAFERCILWRYFRED
jgi:hypothetical protein